MSHKKTSWCCKVLECSVESNFTNHSSDQKLSNSSEIQALSKFASHLHQNFAINRRIKDLVHAIFCNKISSQLPLCHQVAGMCLSIFMSLRQILKLALWHCKKCFSPKTAKTCVKNTLKPDILIVAFYPKPSLANNWKIVSSLCSSWALIWWFVFKGWAVTWKRMLLLRTGCSRK